VVVSVKVKVPPVNVPLPTCVQLLSGKAMLVAARTLYVESPGPIPLSWKFPLPFTPKAWTCGTDVPV
jgi:hypothetical protein